MTAPTLDDFPTLGLIPCPGDHVSVTGVVRTLQQTTDALGEAVRVLRGADKGDWRGKTADAFRELLAEDFRPKVEKAHESFSMARRALDDWSAYLLEHQKKAARLEESAAAEAAALRKAEEAKKAEKQRGPGGGEARPSGGGDPQAEDDPLEEFRRRARAMREAFESEGGEIARRLKDAADVAPDEPGFWDKLGDKIGGALSDIGDWVKDNADWITVAASVIGVAAIFFPALAPVAMALSAVALLAHGAKYGKDGLWPPSRDKIGNYLTLGGDVLGAVPGFGAVFKGASAGVKAARTANATQGAVRSTKVGVTTAAKGANYAAKAADPALPLITKPVEAAATRLGASTANAQRIADGVQAGAALAWTAPTAVNAVAPSDSAANAANWGTGIGSIGTGSGSGKFGGLVAVGSFVGLGGWATR